VDAPDTHLFDSGPLNPMPVAAPSRAALWLAKVAAGPIVALGGLVVFAALSVVLLLYPGETADRLAVLVGPLVPALGAIAVWAVTAVEPGRPRHLRALRWIARVAVLAGVPAELLRLSAAGTTELGALDPVTAAGAFLAASAIWLIGLAVALQYLELLARRLRDAPLRWSFAALKFLAAFTLGLFVINAATGWGAGGSDRPGGESPTIDPAAARGLLIVSLGLCAVLAYVALRLLTRLTAAARQIAAMGGPAGE
jgi:uncharacterized membrane protein YhaH (DUF805 family)